MKKLTALILALIMVFALCACSDGGEDEDNSDAESQEDGKIDDEGNYVYEDEDGGFIVQNANPMEEVSADTLSSQLGVSLVPPEGSSDVKYFIISGTLGNVQFMYDGKKYDYRVQKTDKLEDVSGVYLADPITPEDLADTQGFGKGDGEYCVYLWYKDGYSYSVSCATADQELIKTMHALLES